MKAVLRILITAGPTVEPIDPIRFISNRSTGRMGYALAEAAKKRNCHVTLISGPTCMEPPGGVTCIRIETARDLQKEIHRRIGQADALIMASAVSDFRPLARAQGKIKTKKRLTLKLVRNDDILRSLSKKQRTGKIIVGFALETERLLANAAKKARSKQTDVTVANRCGKRCVPFGGGKKTVYLLDREGRVRRLKNVTKVRIAHAILDTIEELCYTPV